MLDPILNGGLFLLQFLFDTYILILTLRLLMQYTGVNFYNPIAQFIVKVTKPVLSGFQRFLPAYKGVDFSIIAIIFILDIIKFFLIIYFKFQVLANPLGLIVWTFGDFASQLIDIFFFAILLYAIFSWFMPRHYNPLYEILSRLSSLVLTPISRIIPVLGGLDISPIIAILALKLLDIVVISPLLGLGFKMAMS